MNTSILLKISTILWVIWGLVHLFAGVVVMSSETTMAVQAIADGTDKNSLISNYPAAAGAIINQHGWNLAWFGVATIIGGIFIWSGNATAIFVTALIGGLADLGYFIFLDLGGYVNFVPGTIMTLVSSFAIVLSFLAYYRNRR